MKTAAFKIFLLFGFLYGCTDTGRFSVENREMGYRIEGDEVVFEFDMRDYERLSSSQGREFDFKDIDIKKITVAGEFNNWSQDGWTMHKITPEIYQLRKKLSDFRGKLEWQYKFVINGSYWVEPPSEAKNVKSFSPWLNRHRNLVLNVTEPSIKGNTTFRLKGHDKAAKVILAGDFNDWDESQIRFGKENDEWVCRLDLPEGKYHYKFIVDGHWITDPTNQMLENDGEGNLNSVLFKGGLVSFRLKGYEEARKVILAGEFNNWNENLMKMRREGNYWVYSLNLPEGVYHYKFIVDGDWMLDPANSSYEDDGRGHLNSVLEVR